MALWPLYASVLCQFAHQWPSSLRPPLETVELLVGLNGLGELGVQEFEGLDMRKVAAISVDETMSCIPTLKHFVFRNSQTLEIGRRAREGVGAALPLLLRSGRLNFAEGGSRC